MYIYIYIYLYIHLYIYIYTRTFGEKHTRTHNDFCYNARNGGSINELFAPTTSAPAVW